MTRRFLRLWLALIVLAASTAWAATTSTGAVAEGTKWATPYFVRDTGVAGPTVLIVGGVHGNEPAGAVAARQIRHWPIAKGKVVVVPRANVMALDAGKRLLPTEADRDLNRNFPRKEGEAPRGELATALWRLACEVRPDWFVDLHEGFGFRRQTQKTSGSSVIYLPLTVSKAQAERVLAAADATVTDPKKRLVLLRGSAVGSLSRAAGERLGARSMILETTFRDQPLSLRARQHRLMVHRLLSDLGMAACGPDQLFPLRRSHDEIRVALYDAGGSSGSKLKVKATLEDVREARIEHVGPPEILAGALSQFDVVVLPGGSASKEAAALTPAGREAIRRFVERGRGYVGICAGAYLAASNYTWSLGIADANVIDRSHWKRGTGMVEIELSPDGRRLLGDRAGRFAIRYANGPLLAPANRPEIPDFTPLAYFRSEMNKIGAPQGVMLDTPAIVCGRFGRGRVFVSSPHPESTPGLGPILHRAVRWASARHQALPK